MYRHQLSALFEADDQRFAFYQRPRPTILSITDSAYSPIAPFAKYLLVARSDMASFVDSLVAPLSLVNALIVAATLSRRGEVSENLYKLEKIWDEYQVYEKVEESREDEE